MDDREELTRILGADKMPDGEKIMDSIERGQVWRAIGYPGSQLTILSVGNHGVTFWRPGYSGVMTQEQLRSGWAMVERPNVSRRRKPPR